MYIAHNYSNSIIICMMALISIFCSHRVTAFTKMIIRNNINRMDISSCTQLFSSEPAESLIGVKSSTNNIEEENRLTQPEKKDEKRKRSKQHPPPLPPDPSSFPSWSYEPRDFFRYELIYQSKKSMARVGRIHTPHGIIDTPGYVAVATNGALKVRRNIQYYS